MPERFAQAIWTGDQLQGAQGGEENPQDDPTEARSGRGDPRDRSVEAQAGGRAGEEEEAHEDDGEEPFWASELSQLEDMGFRDRSHCTAVLSAVGGNISAAIGVLLNS